MKTLDNFKKNHIYGPNATSASTLPPSFENSISLVNKKHNENYPASRWHKK